MSLPLQLDFRISFGIFHALNIFSLLLVAFLFLIYWMGRRNLLLRSGCVLCFSTSLMLIINWWRGDAHVQGGPLCDLQAVILNYSYVALHGHFCFFMVNSCFSALSWSFFGSKRPELRTLLFIIVAWTIPVLPSSFAIWRFLDGTRPPIVLARPFYCSIKSPSWPLFRFWFFVYSGPGLFFSFYLLWRTWRYRQNTLNVSKTTQIDKSELFRLVLAIVLYLALIGLSLGGSTRRGQKLNIKAAKFNLPSDLNPYRTPNYCITCDPRTEYSCAVLCPSAKSYLPVIVGLCLFAMYGFGAVARKFYRRFSRKISEIVPGTTGGTNDSSSLSNQSISRLPPSKSSRLSLPVSLSSADFDSSRFNFDPSLATVAIDRNRQQQHHHHHHHHPTLPSIDEDLEVFYLGGVSPASSGNNNNSGLSRHMQRRFSEPCTIPKR
jgi:hypothetical protein